MTQTTLDNLEWLLGPEDTMEDMRTWRMEEPVFWNTDARDMGFSLLDSGTLITLNETWIDTCNNQHLKCSHFEKLHFALYNYTIENATSTHFVGAHGPCCFTPPSWPSCTWPWPNTTATTNDEIKDDNKTYKCDNAIEKCTSPEPPSIQNPRSQISNKQ
mgnify:CR=1 FL=1